MDFLFVELPAQVQGLASWELLFWLPTLMDALLLIVTYGSCTVHGVTWYLHTQAAAIAGQKDAARKKNDPQDGSAKVKGEDSVEFDLNPEVHAVWDLALAAYNGYACLLPLSIYWCVVRPEIRTSFCWAMCTLMLLKTQHLAKESAHETMTDFKRKQGLNALMYFYLPTYGGYAFLKSFVLVGP